MFCLVKETNSPSGLRECPFVEGEQIWNKMKRIQIPKWKNLHFFSSLRTLVAKNISTKKYYQRVSKLEIDNSNGNVEEESQISDDVNELNSRILKATESPKVQVRHTGLKNFLSWNFFVYWLLIGDFEIAIHLEEKKMFLCKVKHVLN